MSALQVLVIDDEPAIRQVLAASLARAGYVTEHLGSGQEALARLGKGDIDVAVCDIRMPDMSGIDVVREARAAGIETTFLMMTAYASVSTAIEAMRAGAHDYMIKPVRNEDVVLRLEQMGKFIRLRDENRTLRSILFGARNDRCAFVTTEMKLVEKLASKVAPTDSTVLITGESGTGKGVFARAIHEQSPRAGMPFIPVNCGAIPENLLESEFFGHVKGAFTGADRAKKGLFVEADRGTLFLDEVGELPLHLQVKLLNAIDEKEVRAVGAERGRKVDVRIVAATNRDLKKLVDEGKFREDLYFRLNVFHLHIPALRERPHDIEALLRFFLERNARRAGHRQAHVLDPDADGLLRSYAWPGNVRELENVIERAHILAEGGVITVDDLPASLHGPARVLAPAVACPDGPCRSLREQVRAYEMGVILRAIEDAGGDRRLAAQRLQVGLSTLYRKLEEADTPVEAGPLAGN